MSQFDYIKDIAKFGLENDQEKLMSTLNELIEHSKNTKKINFALQLQSILKESMREQKTNVLTKVGSENYFSRQDERDLNDLILEKLTSDYRMSNLIATNAIRNQMLRFIKEHNSVELLRMYDLPVANKILLHGPSGCGKTLASYVLAGELNKMMVVVNLGSIVSAKLGETSKNLSKIFRRAAAEDCIIFIDEFDSLGKVRDYSQDHGEMKRVVNTILQLFDYLPQSSIVVAATNQRDMLDDAVLRRFDMNIEFDLPDKVQINDLIALTLQKGNFRFDKPFEVSGLMPDLLGLSYYSIQKTLIEAIKSALFEKKSTTVSLSTTINIAVWKELVLQERSSLKVKNRD